MSNREEGNLFIVLIVACIVTGVIGMVFQALWFWIWFMLTPITGADDKSMVCAKLARRYRRQMCGLGAIACISLALVLAAMIVRLGTVHRSGDNRKVNFSYFAIGEAIAFVALGLSAGVFYWIQSTLNRWILAGMWLAWCVAFGLGALPTDENQRQFFFFFGIAFQVMSLVFMWIASNGFRGLMSVLKGIIPLGMLLMCLVVYDIYWYIGYLNNHQVGLHDRTRWHAHLAWFMASLVAHVVVPAWWIWFYAAKSEEVNMEMNYAASVAIVPMEEGHHHHRLMDHMHMHSHMHAPAAASSE